MFKFDTVKNFLVDNKELIIEQGIIIAGTILGLMIVGISMGNFSPEIIAEEMNEEGNV